MSNKTLTVHEALLLFDEIDITNEDDLDPDWSDDDSSSKETCIVIEPPDEKHDAWTDEDSDVEDTGNPDRLPRRLLNAPALIGHGSTHRFNTAVSSSAPSCDADTPLRHPVELDGTTPISTGSVIKIVNNHQVPTRASARYLKRKLSISKDDLPDAVVESPDGVEPSESADASNIQSPPPPKRKRKRCKIAVKVSKSSNIKKLTMTDKIDRKKYAYQEKIKSKIPDLATSNANARSHSCLCESPLRSCPLRTDSAPINSGGQVQPDDQVPSPRRDATTDYSDPMECFRYFFENVVQFTTLQSNIYAVSRQMKQEVICHKEMWGFIAILINSMYMPCSNRELYWSCDKDVGISGIRDIMARNRFQEIMKSLHFRDNNQMPADNQDKYYKVRPLFTNLNQKLEVFRNGDNISIDESMVPYFGFHGTKQYMKGKPHKFGFKMWVACNPDGLPLYVEPYCGISTDVKDHGLGKSSNVVAHLTDRLGLAEGADVFADNYFLSPALLIWATERKIGLTGTLRRNRLGDIPKVEIGKVPGVYKSVVDKKNQVIYTTWEDRKTVTVASNHFGCEPLQSVTVGKGTSKKTVTKPELIVKYNQNMGGVDLMDYFLSIYRPRIRSKKWYWPLFSWILGVSLLASWKLWLSHSTSEQKKNRRGGFLHYLRMVNWGIRRGFGQSARCGPERALIAQDAASRYDGKDHIIFETHQASMDHRILHVIRR